LLKILIVQDYSFIYHPLEKLHDVIPKLLPGIEKIITIHYDETRKLITGILSEKNNHKYSTQHLNIDKILPSLQRYMEDKNPFDWYSKQNLPFEIKVESMNPRMNIFSELQNIVLLIRVPDSLNEFNDLIFLYLNENPSNFGVTNSINPLTTDNKSIIAFVLNNAIKTFIELQKTDRDTLKSFNNRTRQVIGRTESMKYEMQRIRENYGISLVKLFQQYVREYSVKNRKKYTLSSGALEKIKNYKGDLKNLERIALDTVSYVNSLYIDNAGEIEILEWHIHFDGNGQPEYIKKTSERRDDKYGKTLTLLDKLEKAALVVKSRQLKMTGTNVGKACQVPISAPAISDALYNHKSKINSLLKIHPDRWDTIRSEFRPLKNILKDDEEGNQ